MTAGSGTRTDERIYCGKLARTTTASVQYRCCCGSLVPCELVVSVDVQADSDTACQATEQGAERHLHRFECPVCGEAQVAATPFTYHDGEQRLFVLVLPDSYRSRELQERAALLATLAKEGNPVPSYVSDAKVAYDSKGLADVLVRRLGQQDEASRDAKRLREANERLAQAEERLAEAAERESRVTEREVELAGLTDSLDARSSRLTEQELGLSDRKGALDRRSEELERMTVAIDEAKEQLSREGRTELPAALRNDATEALSMDDILTSAPGPEGGQITSVMTASGSAETNTRVSTPLEGPLAIEAVDDEDDAPILLTAQARVAKPAQRRSDARATTQVAPGRSAEVTLAGDTAPDLMVKAPRSNREPAQAAGVIGGGPSDVANLAEEAAASSAPAKVEAWRRRRETHLKLLTQSDVSLVTSVQRGELEELLAPDIRALLQLHRMPTYPLVSLTLARASTLAGQPGAPYSFHFDVGSAEDRAVLSQLANDFRFRLEIFDGERNPVRQRKLTAPLASNVNYVVALATDARKELAPQERNFARAIMAFSRHGYDRLGRGHKLARDFKDGLLDQLDSPTALLGAIALCERFSGSPGEDYLVAIRSYPFERWHQRRLQVIKKAIASGLWMGGPLARVAVSEELVRSRRELVALCKANFQALTERGDCGLSTSTIQENWDALAAESSALAVANAKSARTKAPTGATTEEQLLLAQLEDPKGRLEAIRCLCEIQSVLSLDLLFRAIAQLDSRQAAVAFAAITRLGNQASSSLIGLLKSPSSHLRHGAALALCELGNEEGVDLLCESLMTGEGTLWREYAVALGRVGSSAVMPLASRLRDADQRGQARAVWALGYVVLGGASKPVETLAGGRDQSVSHVARSAIELSQRIQSEAVNPERSAIEHEFTDAFVAALGGANPGYAPADLSEPAMMLDDADLIEAT